MPQQKSSFRLRVVSAVLAIFMLIVTGTVAYRMLEDWTWAESFYFSVATLTTVGYGDIHPTTDTSRMFTAFYILIGVGIAFTAFTSLGSRYLDRQENRLSTNITRRIRTKSKKRR